MFTVKDSFETCPTLMRDACCNTLMEMAEKNKDVVVLDSDLVNSSGLKPFFKFFPDRAIECGIAEANMIGIAAGLSAVGKVPFAHSFGCFASRRVCDQIMISCSYAKLNVRIIGSDPDSKVKKLLDYTGEGGNVADPWYSGNFEETYKDVCRGCEAVYAALTESL